MPGTVGAQDEYTLEDTIVIASKMGETMLQETALSIKVFDSELIDDLAAFNVEDLANFDASLKFVRNPFAGIVILTPFFPFIFHLNFFV